MAKSLIIVESPAKTKSLKAYLGSEYDVEASVGHIRDLPKSWNPASIETPFDVPYEVTKDRQETVKKLRAAAKKVDMIYLASDPDREGEAIAWHVAQILDQPSSKVKRIVFNEITKTAVLDALKSPREVTVDRVNAQQARRVIDRFEGYGMSSQVQAKVKNATHAGRVQSVALRLIVDRERAIEAFVPVEYWSVTATLSKLSPTKPQFPAKLKSFNGKKLGDHELDQATAEAVVSDCESKSWTVVSVATKEAKERAKAPFITSTLQQEAARRLGYGAQRTMRIAQNLYEGIDVGGADGTTGLITYMRTDSTRVAAEAQSAARGFIASHYGEQYLPASPNVYGNKGAAQDAHEAIRPTDVNRTPDSLRNSTLTADQLKLYTLIWNRFVASQMAPATFDQTSVDIEVGAAIFHATGRVRKFDGHLRVYEEGRDDVAAEKVDAESGRILPPMEKGEVLKLHALVPKQHFTDPPPRFTEASLVKALEENKVGRPSTYASIMEKIRADYVEVIDKRFHPNPIGCAVTDTLVADLPKFVDVKYTANLEDGLDEVAEGQRDWVEFLRSVHEEFKSAIDQSIPNCPNCGKELVLKRGRFGQFYACSGYPECNYILKSKAVAKAEPSVPPKLLDEPCPECGAQLSERVSRFGKTFVGCSAFPKCRYIKKDIPVSTGLKCPLCKDGDIVEKGSKRGTFYGCSSYPSCKCTLSGLPLTDRQCPDCGGILHHAYFRGRYTGIQCVTKECKYKEKGQDPRPPRAVAPETAVVATNSEVETA